MKLIGGYYRGAARRLNGIRNLVLNGLQEIVACFRYPERNNKAKPVYLDGKIQW